MGRTRTAPQPRPQQTRQQSSEEEIAAAIAMVLAGSLVISGTTPLAAIAALLLRIPDAPDLDVRRAAARLVLEDSPEVPRGAGALRTAYRDNLLYRAWYAVNATKRLGASVAGGEDLRGALKVEARYFAQHREANRRREAGARMVEAAVELHGPVLGWKHGSPQEPRPSHLAADGKNFDARRVPVSTGALPGVLPGCTCTVTAPSPGAEMLR